MKRIVQWIKNPYLTLSINGIYAVSNCVLGFLTPSLWFVTVGAYYILLAVMRFSVLKITKSTKDRDIRAFSRKVTGILFVVMAAFLLGMVILSAVKERGSQFHEIVMITIALYTFVKITFAIMGMAKRKTDTPLRYIAFADALVSVCSLQRSMLVSFPGMQPQDIQLMNILTGSAVTLLIVWMGILLTSYRVGRCVDMAKSKLVEINEKIADGVVGGYKKMENGVVDGYKKIEDKFVDQYLTKDGETVEQAKERLKNQQK